jgi:hypothetical protein
MLPPAFATDGMWDLAARQTDVGEHPVIHPLQLIDRPLFAERAKPCSDRGAGRGRDPRGHVQGELVKAARSAWRGRKGNSVNALERSRSVHFHVVVLSRLWPHGRVGLPRARIVHGG